MKKDIQRLFTDLCTVYIYENTENDGITNQEKKILYENIKCRISFRDKNFTDTQSKELVNSSARINKQIKLFVSSQYVIPAGSSIEVTRGGEKMTYVNSGVESVYDSHREIILELFEKWG